MWLKQRLSGVKILKKLYKKFFESRTELTEAEYRRSRNLFVVEAGVLPLVSVAVSGTYLAAFFDMLGASEALSGVLLSCGSVAAVMQFFVPMLSATMRSKKALSVFSVAFSRLCGALMLMLPMFFGISRVTLAVCSVLLIAYVFISQIYVPLQATWIMSLLPLPMRGEYFGKKDALNYISVAVASYLYGAILDFYEVSGALRTGFFIFGVIAAIGGFACSASELYICEPRQPAVKKRPGIREMLSACFGNARFYKLMKITLMYDLLLYSSLAYLSIYVVTQLHISYFYISIVSFVCVGVKALAAPLWGKFAAKTSFAGCAKCAGYVLLASYLLWALTVQENAMWMYPIAMCVNAVGMSGTAFSIFAIKFDIVLPEEQNLFISVGNAASGIISFAIALLASAFVDISGALSLDIGIVRLGNMQLLFLVSAVFNLLFCLFLKHQKKQA